MKRILFIISLLFFISGQSSALKTIRMYPTDGSTGSYQHDKRKIAIYGDEFKSLAKKIKRGVNGFETTYLTRTGLNTVSIADGQLLLLSGNTPLPPESRIGINRYLSTGGNVIIVGDKGFDYTPQATDEVPLVLSLIHI